MKKLSSLLLVVLSVLFLSAYSNAQIAVTVDNPTNTTPNLASTYTSFAAALTDLNIVTAMSGPITLTLTAGGSETAPVKGFVLGSATLNPVLSATNAITITTTGTVTINAGVGTSAGPSATPDGMLVINGADYVTINGITFTDGNTTNSTVAMEFGIALFKRSAGDGSNNNTISNCTFNMQRVNNASGTAPLVDGSVSIGVYNSVYTAATTALTPTNGGTLATNGTNSNNKFYTNTMNSGNYGIALIGFAASSGVGPNPNATTFLGDIGNDVGGSSAGQGNTILNYGGGGTTNAAAGIRANNQWSLNISYNTINNNNGSGVNHATTLRGIYGQAGTSANVTISNNKVTIKGGGTTQQVSAIENSIGSTSASNTVNINSNTVENCAYSTGTSGTFYNIYNTATAATVNINNNIIRNSTYTGAITTGNFFGITNLATGVVSINSNSISNLTIGGTSTTAYCISVGSPTGAGCSANNNTITNIFRTGASGTQRGIIMTSPTNNMTFNNNTIDSIFFTNTASTGSIDGIYGFSSGTNITISNNTIRNLSIPTTGVINGIREFGSSGAKIIQNNQIYNFSTYAGGAGGATFNGISLATGNQTISGNQVYSLNSTGSTGGTGGTVYGINISGGTTNLVYNNKINNLSSNSTNPVVAGITNSSGTTNNIYNNYISDLRAPASTGANSVIGLNISGGTTINAFYNTVYLNASGGSTFGSSAVSKSATTTSEFRNNIFVNVSTPGSTSGNTVAIRWSTNYSATYYTSTSNNNCLYAGTPAANNLIFFDGTNSDQTIGAYKTRVASRDASSFTELPPFVNVATTPYDLHIQTTVPTQLEKGGSPVTTPVAITDDYDGNIRNVTLPDVGADEGDFTPLDLTPPVITYTPLPNTALTGNRTLTTSITDGTGVPTSGTGLPVLYWSINSPTGPFTAVTAVYVSGNQYNFTFGAGTALNDSVYYYIVAQDVVTPTPNVGAFPSGGASGFTSDPPAASTPPTSPSIYRIIGSFTGTILVGTGQTYTSLTADAADGLFKAINSRIVTGNLTVKITSDITETGAIALNQTVEEAIYTINIEPNDATVKTISGSYAGGLIRLNGADGVTFDGRYGGSGKYLTFRNSNTSNPVFTFTNAASSNTIRDCNIEGASTSSSNGVIFFTTGANTGNTLLNCNIKNIDASNRPYNGIYFGDVANLNNTISGCKIYDFTTYGIYISAATGTTIELSDIYLNTASISTTLFGVYIGNTNATTLTKISRNKIHDLNGASTATIKGIYYPGTTGINMNVSVENNFIYLSPVTTGTVDGIDYYGYPSNSLSLYYNSIYIGGNPASGTNLSTAVRKRDATTNFIQKNNILYNARSNAGGTGTGSHYAIYISNTTSTVMDLNYNDYYVSGGGGVLGYWNAANQADLATWKTASSQDANSVSGDPKFVSNTDLHIQTDKISPVSEAGTPIAGITTDFDGNTRSLTTPDIGADEYTYVPPSVLDPASFAATKVHSTQIDLSWTPTGEPANPVMVVYNTSDVFGVPDAGRQYNERDEITGGGTVLYLGTNVSYSHTGLTRNTTYYYKAFSYTDLDYQYSPGATSNATTSYPAVPGSLTATTISGTQIDLAWTKNTAGNDVIIATNSINTFGDPIQGKTYSATDTLGLGGTIIYKGSATSFNHTGLTQATAYFYKAWSVDGGVGYSTTAKIANGTTAFGIPYTQDFNASLSYPSGWAGDMSISASHGAGSSNGLYKNLYSSSTTGNSTGPQIGTVASNTFLNFDYRIVNYTSYPGTATTLTSGDGNNIQIQISSNGGANYTTIHTIDYSNHITSTSFATKSLPLSAFAGQNIKFKVLGTWGTGDYYIDFDNFSVFNAENMTYDSSNTTQNTNSLLTGATDQDIIRVKIATTNSLNPLSATSFTFNTNGTTSTSDITEAKLWKTAGATFTSPTQLGTTVSNPNGSFSFDLTSTPSTLSAGPNYFWLTYSVSGSATPGNILDAECNSFTLSDGSHTPTVVAPAGGRTIVGPLNGTFAIGAGLFNSVTGRNVYPVEMTRTVKVRVPEEESKEQDGLKGEEIKGNREARHEQRFVEKDVEEKYTVMYENGQPCVGTLWIDMKDVDKKKVTENIETRKNEVRDEIKTGKYGKGNEKSPVNYETDNPLTYAEVFATVSDAISALNTRGISGPVTFEFTDASYTGVTAQTINAITNSSATNTVTFKPQAGETVSITGSSSSAIFNLNGADYVIFDGSNNGSSSKNMTITNTNAAISTYSIYVYNAGNNNIVRNCNLYSEYRTVFITNSDNCQIVNNDISGNPLGSNRNSQAGVYISGTSKNISIKQNMIHDFYYTGTTGYGCYGVYWGSSDVSMESEISNNVIYNIKADGDEVSGGTSNFAYIPAGIAVNTGGNLRIYYNSIYLSGNMLNSAGTYYGNSSCITINSTVSLLDIRNNALQNSMTTSSGTGTLQKTYAVVSYAANTAFTNIDYNNYFTNGINPKVGYITSADASTLSAWKTASGKDWYSVSGNPGFTSVTNLQPDVTSNNCWNLNAGAYPMASVSTDILGNPRSTNITGGAADIGAYEFTPGGSTAANLTVSGTPSDGLTTTVTFSGYTLATITWHGLSLPSGITANYKPGVNPSNTPEGGKFANEIFEITATGGSEYTYDITFKYNLARQGTISSESNFRLGKYSGSEWTQYPDLPNQTAKTITVTGLNSFSIFTSGDNDNPLPVNLSAFTSALSGRDVKLTWKTENESNNAGFEIERAAADIDNPVYMKIGYVNGHGTSTTQHTYTFDDKKLNSGKYNYRLKQVDFNGNFTYHNLSNQVEVGLPTKFDLSQNYPNPFNPSTKIDFALPTDSRVNIVLYDITGREVKTLVNDSRKAGYYTLQFNASDLSSGTYFYRIMTKSGAQDFVMTKKMMLVK